MSKRFIAASLSVIMLLSMLFVNGIFAFTTFGNAQNYYGLFYDEHSDGGFEYNGWSTLTDTTTSNNSKWEKTSSVRHRGSSSAKFRFDENNKKTISITMNFSELMDIDIADGEDFCWTAWIKTDSDFWGTVKLKMYDASKPSSAGLKNTMNYDSVTIYDTSSSNNVNNWTRFDTSATTKLYRAAKVKDYIADKTSVDVVLEVSADYGTIWIDDLDFKWISTLSDPEEVPREDNSGSAKGNYEGLFDDTTSDGAFENGIWTLSDSSTVSQNSKFAFSSKVRYNNKRSASFEFADGSNDTFIIKSEFKDISEIDITQNYAWSLYVKTNGDFSGKVWVKLCEPGAVAGGLQTVSNLEKALIFDSETMDASSWKQFNSANDYYSSAKLSTFLTNGQVLADGAVSLVIVVEGTKGKVWVDDLDFQKRAFILGDDDAVVSGDYDGLFDDSTSNGGFEHGKWNTVDSLTTAQKPSISIIDTSVKNFGNRSLLADFRNSMPETFTYRTTFDDINEIDKSSDYFWKLYSKAAAGFDGKITLKITAAGDSSVVLKNSENKTDVVVYDSSVNGLTSTFSAYTTVNARYNDDDVKDFIENAVVSANGFDVILTITATTGMVWVDDIDFISFDSAIGGLCLEDPNTVYNVDDSDYIGIFESQSSNGGFEYGPWTFDKALSTATVPSSYVTDVNNKNTGKRALKVQFNNGTKETLVLKMTSPEAAQLISKDYALSAFIKTSSDFKGSVSVRITQHNDYSNVLKNSDNKSDIVLLSGSTYNSFTRVDNITTPFTASAVNAFKQGLDAEGFDVYLIFTASKGEVWVDDINLLTTEDLENEKNEPAADPVYNGIFVNGGFENGAWNYSNIENHSVETITQGTYNASLKSLKITSTKALGHSGALKLFGKTSEGKAAQLDITKKYIMALKYLVPDTFNGSVYVEIKNGDTLVSYNDSTRIYLINNNEITVPNWSSLYTAPFEITGDDISVTLYLDGVGSVIIDDVDIIVDPQDGNLIPNGGFESGVWGGHTASGATVQQEFVVTDNSPASIKINGTATRSFYFVTTHSGAVDPEKDYKLSVSMKTVGMKYGAAYMMVLYCGPGKSQWARVHGQERFLSTGGNTNWKTYTALLTDVPEWATSFQVYVNCESAGTLYADNVYLTDKVTEEDYENDKGGSVPGAIYDGNVYNGGFEAEFWPVSKVNDQEISIDTTTTHNGSLGALRVDMVQRYNYPNGLTFDSFTVGGAADKFDTSKKYSVGLWFKSSEDFVGNVYVRVAQNGNYKWYNWETELHLLGHSRTGVTGYKDWTFLYCPAFEVTNDDVTLSLVVDGVGTVWIDDVSVIVDPQEDNYISNGGFESGAWSTWGSEGSSGTKYTGTVTDVTNNSAKAGILSSTSEGEFFIVSGFKKTIDVNETYRFSVDLKTQDVDMDCVYIRMLQWFTDADGNKGTSWLKLYGNEDFIKTGGTTDWTTYAINAKGFNKNLDSITLYIYLKGKGTVWVDNVSMTVKEKSEVEAGTVGADIEPGEVNALDAVHLYTSDENSDIYYTVDGSDPRKSQTALLMDPVAGILITEDVYIRAYAVGEETESDVFDFKYTCKSPLVKDDVLWDHSSSEWQITLDNSDCKVGKNSLVLEGNGSNLYTCTGEISIDPLFDYKVEFWAKTEDMQQDNAANINILLNGGAKADKLDCGKESGAYFGNKDKLVSFKSGDGWKHYEFTIDEINGYYSGITVIASIDYDFGKLYIDGLKITAIQKQNWALQVSGDGKVWGNNYYESLVSSFEIEQGFLITSDANVMENGVIAYKVYNDDEPDEILVEGDMEINVMPHATTSSSINLSAVAKYGTFTIDFEMTNSRGLTYPMGSIKLARLRDSSEINDDSVFGVCVNYEQMDYDILDKTGVSTVRFDLDWEDVEISQGNYQIKQSVIDAINIGNELGIDSIVIFNSHHWPSWYSYEGSSGFPKTEQQIEMFMGYVRYVVEYFGDKVKFYELFNETNFMTYSKVDGAGYTKLLKRVYTEIKRISPNSNVIGGVMASVGPGKGVDLSYGKDMIEAGAANYMDYMSFHPYIQPYSPESVDWASQIQSMQDMIKSKTGKVIPFIFTEIGWSAYYGNTGVTEEQKMNYFTRTYAWAEALGYVDRIVLYREGSNELKYNFESKWGVFNSVDPKSGTANPLGVAMSNFVYMRNQFDFSKKVKLADNLYAFKYKGNANNPKKDMYMIWTDDKEYIGEITLSDDSGKLYDVYGNVVSIFYNENTFNADISGRPIYITVNKGSEITGIKLIDPNQTTTENNNASSPEKEDNGEEIIETADDEPQTPSKKKVIKKVVKKVIKKGDKGDDFNWVTIAIIVSVAAVVIAGVTVFLIIFIKKRKKKLIV